MDTPVLHRAHLFLPYPSGSLVLIPGQAESPRVPCLLLAAPLGALIWILGGLSSHHSENKELVSSLDTAPGKLSTQANGWINVTTLGLKWSRHRNLGPSLVPVS